MRRAVSLEEISDGHLYRENDMVKADCHGCHGCHTCCTGMGSSIILDPFDMWRLQTATGKNLQELLNEEKIELNIVDGCILPNLKMLGTREACAFLNDAGRCSIHSARPGICRLFPLGRYYENGDFQYFLQTGECPEKNRSKIKVEKWIDTPNLKQNHEMVRTWHYLLKATEEAIFTKSEGEYAKQLNMRLLTMFYFIGAPTEQDFYEAFYERVEVICRQFSLQIASTQ